MTIVTFKGSNSGQLRSCPALPKGALSGSTAKILDWENLLAVLNKCVTDISVYAPQYYPAAKLQLLTGCRAIEAWQTERWKYIERGVYVLLTAKRGNIRDFHFSQTAEIDSLIKSQKAIVERGFSFENYRRIIRYNLQQQGVYYVNKRGAKEGSTHLFRHCYVKGLLNCGTEIDVIQQRLGEKTLKSTLVYVNSIIFKNLNS